MSQNRTTGGSTQGQGTPSTTGTTGGAGTGATDMGTTRASSTGTTPSTSSSSGREQGLTPSTGTRSTGSGASAGTATGLSATAQEYGQKISDAATQAKDYVSDKMSVVGDKIKDIQNKDFSEVANDAKAYARQNPGQAILISAAAGLVLGLLLRGSRR